jgi:hypothetical protein
VADLVEAVEADFNCRRSWRKKLLPRWHGMRGEKFPDYFVRFQIIAGLANFIRRNVWLLAAGPEVPAIHDAVQHNFRALRAIRVGIYICL